jgi:hypothetical protein
MSWIKRNLFFTIGSVIALALMGLAGWFLYTKWNLNNQIFGNLNTYYEELKGLKSKNPHPGDAKVDNIKIAKQQQGQLSNYVATARVHFEPIPRIPSAEEAPKVTDHDFTTALSRTIDQLQRDASAASVSLIITNYNFSFEAQRRQVSFNAPGLLPLATQLGEVKAICDILFAAKINSLENIRRERVSAEDSQGLQTDYLTEKRTTNDLAILTPYELTFKCFSTELSTVLAGFASSPYGMIVKTINVEGAPIPPPAEPTTSTIPVFLQQPPPQPQNPYGAQNPYAPQNPFLATPYGTQGGMDSTMASRYGLGPGGGRYGPRPAPTPAPQPYVAPQAVAAPKSTALQTVLDERQLKVTINLVLIKLLPPPAK